MLKKKLKDIWDELPNIEHTKKYKDEKTGLMVYEVCGKKFQDTTPIKIVLDCLENFYKQYGKRAEDAKNNKNIDFKSLSHAFRAGYQLKEIYETGDLKYPLKEAEFIKNIKQGKYHYQDDNIASKLENLVDEVEVLAKNSSYPEKADRYFFEDWLCDFYGRA